MTGGNEFFMVTSCKDEAGSGAGVTFGESEAKAARTSGNEDDLAGTASGSAGGE